MSSGAVVGAAGGIAITTIGRPPGEQVGAVGLRTMLQQLNIESVGQFEASRIAGSGRSGVDVARGAGSTSGRDSSELCARWGSLCGPFVGASCVTQTPRGGDGRNKWRLGARAFDGHHKTKAADRCWRRPQCHLASWIVR